MLKTEKHTHGGRRKGAGRPLSGNTATIYARVPDGFAFELKQRAKNENLSVGEYLMQHIRF
jgi:hypothetical protein